jgi:hypothetical protein
MLFLVIYLFTLNVQCIQFYVYNHWLHTANISVQFLDYIFIIARLVMSQESVCIWRQQAYCKRIYILLYLKLIFNVVEQSRDITSICGKWHHHLFPWSQSISWCARHCMAILNEQGTLVKLVFCYDNELKISI